MSTPVHHPIGPHRRRKLGVSLVEALVALAVMAFGMLALVGVQATLRLNSDVAKQRTEATRIATQEIDQLRQFSSVLPVPGQAGFAWSTIVTGQRVIPPGSERNTTYTVDRTVTDGTAAAVGGTQVKFVEVQVSWADRTGVTQDVRVDAIIAAIDPAASVRLAVAARPSAISQRLGRHPSIPTEAVDLHGADEGRSAFKPFDRGTVAWVFNNTNGFITSRCTGVVAAQAGVDTTVLASATCETIEGRMVAGVVQFDDMHLPLPSPAALISEAPRGPALPLSAGLPLVFEVSATFQKYNQVVGRDADCVADSPFSLLASATTSKVPYYCLVFLADSKGWGGKLNVQLASAYANGDALPPTPGQPGVPTVPTDYKICRYTTASDYFTLNADHPRSYCIERAKAANAVNYCSGVPVTSNLLNQNFLVIYSPAASPQSCPTDVAAGPSTGDLINSNTLQHQ